MTFQIAILLLALLAAALALVPGTGWAERICAAALLLPTGIGVLDLDPIRAALAFQPSLLLRAALELACLLVLLHAAFTAHRWFPLVMAAAALIGCTARALGFSGLGGAHLPLLQLSALPLLAMAVTLVAAVAARALPRSLSNASA